MTWPSTTWPPRTWQLCVRYPNGQARVLRLFRDREQANRWVDALYSRRGYPMHLAYVIQPSPEPGGGCTDS